MRTLLLIGVSATILATPAYACRGTVEYPETAARLAKFEMPAAEKEQLIKAFNEGEAVHRRGHELDDAELRRQSLKILDEIKTKIAM